MTKTSTICMFQFASQNLTVVLTKIYSYIKRPILLFLTLGFSLGFSENSMGQIINVESFENSTFVPSGWTSQMVGGTALKFSRVTSGINATCSPQNGVAMCQYNSFSNAGGGAGTSQAIISPSFSLQNLGSNIATVSLWVYRENTAYTSATYNTEGITVKINTSGTNTGATTLGYIPRKRSIAATGMASGISIPTTDGWYQYTFNIPTTFNGANNNLIFLATSAYGNNIFIDNISWTSYPSACSGTPSPGNTISSATLVSPGSNVNLSIQNAVSGIGIAYQWQSSTSGSGPWSNIVGATAATYTATVNTSTWYQCVVTCTIGSTFASSTPVQVALISPPVNDACINASTLSCGTLNLPGTTVNSVAEAAPLNFSSSYGVWYSFIGDGQSTTISSTAIFDHEMTIMTGTSCGSFVNVSTQDAALANGTETFTFNTTAGVQYYVYIAHWSTSSVTTGTFTISRTCTLPLWKDTWVSMNIGSNNWCAGETRTISVTVTNSGSATWTNTTPDINIGVKWNGDADYFVRTDANGLAPGATQTYFLTLTAPLTSGTNNLTFDVVNENNFWFANNMNGGGPGNVVFVSPSLTINSLPIVVAGGDVTICNGQSIALSGSVLMNSVVNSTPALTIPDMDPAGVTTTLLITNAMVQASQITGVTVNITHSWDSDLSLFLIAPDGSSIELTSGNGGAGDNYVNTYFTNSGTSITAGIAPFTGVFTPEIPFSNLTGTANGTWTLWAIDNATSDIGTINSWSITYGTAASSAIYSWSPSITLNNSMIINPIASPISTTTYTLTGNLNGCSATDAVTVTLPNTGTSLSQDNESATCLVNQNGWVHFYHSSGKLIGSINSYGQDLGNVTVTSYIDPTSQLIPACNNITDVSTMTNVMQRHWVFVPTNQPVNAVSIRLPFTDAEYTDLFNASTANYNGNDDITNISDIVISKYDGSSVNNSALDNCTTGNTIVVTPNVNGLTASYSLVANSNFLEASISGFSEFWLHGTSNNSALPVELLNFDVQCLNQNQIEVSWSTFSEKNTDRYTIEKSDDALNWELIGVSKAVENSSSKVDYLMVLQSEINQSSYLRLIQFDMDGTSDTLGIINLNCDFQINDFKVFPNPIVNQFSIVFNNPLSVEKKALITILDTKGNIVYSQNYDIGPDFNKLNSNELRIGPGVYVINLKVGSHEFEHRKIVII